jgi:hypothetical protein
MALARDAIGALESTIVVYRPQHSWITVLETSCGV